MLNSGRRDAGWLVRNSRRVGWLTLVITLVVSAATSPFAAADGSYPGGATADATSFSLAIHEGAGSVGIAFGVTSTSFRDTYSAASSKPLDLQLVKVLFGEASRCSGSTDPVPLPDSSLPLELDANSLRPDAGTVIEGDALMPGYQGAPSSGPIGHGSASASAAPSSTAASSVNSIDLGIFSLLDPTTSSHTSWAGGARTATATSSASKLIVLGGLLTIDRPTWTATATSGASTSATASFTTAGGTLFGVPRSPSQSVDDLAGFGQLVHGLLGFIGIDVNMPAVATDGATISISPWRLHLTDSPLGSQLLAPLMSTSLFGQPALGDQVEAALDQAAAQSCDNKRLRQVLEIVLKILQGSGEIEVDLGGATVSTDDTPPPVFDFGADASTDGGAVTPDPQSATTTTLPADPAVRVDDSATGRDAVVTSPLDPTSTEPTTTLDPPRAPGPDEPQIVTFQHAADTRRRSIDGATGGAAVWVGAILAAGGLVGALGERGVGRRRRRAEAAAT